MEATTAVHMWILIFSIMNPTYERFKQQTFWVRIKDVGLLKQVINLKFKINSLD